MPHKRPTAVARGERQQQPLILAMLTQAIVVPGFEIFVAHVYNMLQTNDLHDTYVKIYQYGKFGHNISSVNNSDALDHYQMAYFYLLKK
jgi:hypothetical protein